MHTSHSTRYRSRPVAQSETEPRSSYSLANVLLDAEIRNRYGKRIKLANLVVTGLVTFLALLAVAEVVL